MCQDPWWCSSPGCLSLLPLLHLCRCPSNLFPGFCASAVPVWSWGWAHSLCVYLPWLLSPLQDSPELADSLFKFISFSLISCHHSFLMLPQINTKQAWKVNRKNEKTLFLVRAVALNKPGNMYLAVSAFSVTRNFRDLLPLHNVCILKAYWRQALGTHAKQSVLCGRYGP